MSIRIGLFTIVVDDYDEAIEHYTKALGFELDEDVDQGDKRWVVVRPPGAETGIVLAVASDDQQRAAIGNQTGGRVGKRPSLSHATHDLHLNQVSLRYYLEHCADAFPLMAHQGHPATTDTDGPYRIEMQLARRYLADADLVVNIGHPDQAGRQVAIFGVAGRTGEAD